MMRNHSFLAIVTKNVSEELLRKINKIEGIKSYLYKKEFKPQVIPKDSYVFIGDNWYLVYYNGNISYTILDFDNDAKREFEIVKNIINSSKNDIKKLSSDKINSIVYPVKKFYLTKGIMHK